jgi:hypothetical protein
MEARINESIEFLEGLFSNVKNPDVNINVRHRRKGYSVEIKVIELRFMNSGKALRAFADIQIGNWIIRDFRIIKNNGTRAFVSPPQISWKDPESGEIKYKGIFTFPADKHGEFQYRSSVFLQREMGKQDAHQ